MTILITGGTGSVGGELAKVLSDRGVPLRALVRSPAKARDGLAQLPGVTVVVGDLDDEASLAPALEGVTRAFLLTDSSDRAEARQLAFVAAAKQAGVRHVVKLSQWAADAASPVRFLRYHAVVEQALRDSGMAWTFLRPNLFMQGLLAFKGSIADDGRFFAPAGDARVSVVDVRDIALAAAASLTDGARHEGEIHELTGPAALTHAELAQGLSVALGREITFVDIPPDAMLQALLGMKMPPWQAEGLVEDYAHYRREEAAVVTNGVREATGAEPRSFATFARDHAAAFR